MFPAAFALRAQHLPDLRTPLAATTIRMDGAEAAVSRWHACAQGLGGRHYCQNPWLLA